MVTNEEEEYDNFPAAGGFMLDPDSLALVREDTNNRVGSRGGGGNAVRSLATTQLATDVGSTIGPRKYPFLKSITFFDPKKYYKKAQDEEKEENDTSAEDNNLSDDDVTVDVNDLTHWEISLIDPPINELKQKKKKGIFGKLSKVSDSIRKNNQPALIVENFDGLVEFSSLEAGDRLVSINKKKIQPEEYTAEQAMAYMKQCLEEEGVLFVTTENPLGTDIILNVTVIKPKPQMTYEDLGLVVWNWPYLCVREIKKGSIFEHTALQETDQIAAINDIDCSKMKERSFVRCVNELPTEITITLVRRKHRYTGSYT